MLQNLLGMREKMEEDTDDDVKLITSLYFCELENPHNKICKKEVVISDEQNSKLLLSASVPSRTQPAATLVNGSTSAVPTGPSGTE